MMSCENRRSLSATEGGFTLLELLLVIGVGILLLIGSIYIYRVVTEGHKADQSIRLLVTIRNQAGLLAQQQNTIYTGIAFSSTAASGDLNGGKSPLVIGGTLNTNARNPFGGNITIGPTGTGDINLSIVFDHVSKAGCSRLIPAFTNPSEIISVGTATSTYTSAANQIPVNVTNVSAACDQEFNTVTWVLP